MSAIGKSGRDSDIANRSKLTHDGPTRRVFAVMHNTALNATM
jgi:hypothetical protein